MVDLSKPFEAGLYYNSKSVVIILWRVYCLYSQNDVSYHDLDIQNGLNAVFAYRTYDEKDEEEKKEVKEAISTYCQMDTYAEYVVYHGLIKEVEKDA